MYLLEAHDLSSQRLTYQSHRIATHHHAQGLATMKICLVTTFPPSRGGLSEYGFHIARELQRNPFLSLTVLADDCGGKEPEMEGFSVDLFSQRTGLPWTAIEAGVNSAQDKRLVQRERQWIRPTDHGRRFLNDLVALFLPAQK